MEEEQRGCVVAVVLASLLKERVSCSRLLGADFICIKLYPSYPLSLLRLQHYLQQALRY